jgi:hypothetical protein
MAAGPVPALAESAGTKAATSLRPSLLSSLQSLSVLYINEKYLLKKCFKPLHAGDVWLFVVQ